VKGGGPASPPRGLGTVLAGLLPPDVRTRLARLLAAGAADGAPAAPWIVEIPQHWPPQKPLTAEDGPIQVRPDLRRLAAVMPDGRILVEARARTTTPELVSWLERARTARLPGGRAFEVVPVDLETVTAAYRSTNFGTARRSEVYGNQTLATFFDDMMKDWGGRGVTDAHFITDGPSTRIWLRTDRTLRLERELPAEEGLGILRAVYRLDRRHSSDTDFSADKEQDAKIYDERLPPEVLSIRFSARPGGDDGHRAAMRFHLRSSSDGRSLADMGLAARHIADLETAERTDSGAWLTGGKMGSGKTTLLAVYLQWMMRKAEAAGRRFSGYTLEDPIELPIPGWWQTTVDRSGDDGYRRGAKHTLRMDANKILLSEIRDSETAVEFFRAASRGQQVFSTLHITSAVAIPMLLQQLQVERFLLENSEFFSGLMAQRLVERVCPWCSAEVPVGEYHRHPGLSEPLRDWLAQEVSVGRFARDGMKLRLRDPAAAKSCEFCIDGYSGVELLAETIVPDDEFLRHLVRGGDLQAARRHWLAVIGGVTIGDHAAMKALGGLVDPRDVEQALAKATGRGEIRKLDAPTSPAPVPAHARAQAASPPVGGPAAAPPAAPRAPGGGPAAVPPPPPGWARGLVPVDDAAD
jgi:type II secretory ATPase GspE/PulE/Tfp pilus assembly ATPase PilB-like protein